jgi:hypothetical protein
MPGVTLTFNLNRTAVVHRMHEAHSLQRVFASLPWAACCALIAPETPFMNTSLEEKPGFIIERRSALIDASGQASGPELEEPCSAAMEVP